MQHTGNVHGLASNQFGAGQCGPKGAGDKISNDFSTMSQSFLEQMRVAQEEKSADKCAQYELNLWHVKEKVCQQTTRHDHNLLLQQECQEHEKEMKDKDISVAGGETQDSV